ncbi:MAG: hypothetical protein ACOY3I_02490 [Verrucomicrobiota bacterium]
MSLELSEKVIIGLGIGTIATLLIGVNHAIENRKALEYKNLKENVFAQLSQEGLVSLLNAKEDALFRLKISPQEEVLLFREKDHIAILNTKKNDLIVVEIEGKKQLFLKDKTLPKDLRVFEKNMIGQIGNGEGQTRFLKGRISIKEIQEQYQIRQKNEDRLHRINSRDKSYRAAQGIAGYRAATAGLSRKTWHRVRV